MTTATTKLTLESMRKKWIGRQVYASSDHQLDASGKHPRPVDDIHQNVEDRMYYAWAGEHHRANTLEALDRRLHSLAVQS